MVFQNLLEPPPGGACDVGFELAAMGGKGVDAGPCEFHLIDAAVVGGKHRRVAVEHPKVALELFPAFPAAKKLIKQSHSITPRF